MLKEQKKTQADLCDFLGINKQAFTEWNGGRNNSYIKYLPKIAKYFNVSVDYLLGNEEKPTTTSELSERKRLFIQKVEGMNDLQLERLEQILALVENKAE